MNETIAKGQEKVDPKIVDRLRDLHEVWAERRPTAKGQLLRERFETLVTTWNEHIGSIEEFEEHVLWRLDEFDSSPDPNKREFLGTIGNFLKSGRWKEQLPPEPDPFPEERQPIWEPPPVPEAATRSLLDLPDDEFAKEFPIKPNLAGRLQSKAE